jgi:hypothetical protein
VVALKNKHIEVSKAESSYKVEQKVCRIPTIETYNTGVIKIRSATNSLARFGIKISDVKTL